MLGRETREQRIERKLAAGDAQAAGRPVRPRIRVTAAISQRVGDSLRKLLVEQHSATCTKCFHGTIAELNKLSPHEARDEIPTYAPMIFENVMHAAGENRGWARVMLAKAPRASDPFYKQLLLDACEACEALAGIAAASDWRHDSPAERRWQELSQQGSIDPDYVHKTPWRYLTTADMINALGRLVPQLPQRLAGVAGVPRSGMIPASTLATWLHVPLYEASNQHGLRPIGHGTRGGLIHVDDSAPILVLDDTIYQGGSMTRIRQRLVGERAIFASVYVRPGKQRFVDLFAELLPSPHLLEWNLFNNGIFDGHCRNPVLRGGWAIDFDGVVCHDCTRDGDDTEAGDAAYGDWIRNARPKWLPRMQPIPLVITARLERYREDTLAWCNRWGVAVKRLEMWPGNSFAGRNASDVAQWKAEILQQTEHCGYIESHDRPASRIHALWRRPVLSLESARVYQ